MQQRVITQQAAVQRATERGRNLLASAQRDDSAQTLAMAAGTDSWHAAAYNRHSTALGRQELDRKGQTHSCLNHYRKSIADFKVASIESALKSTMDLR